MHVEQVVFAQERLEGFPAFLPVGGHEVVLAGVVDAVGETEQAELGIGTFAVKPGLAPVHRPLQEIELAAGEHLVAGVPQCLVEVCIGGIHIVLVVLDGLRVVGRDGRHAGPGGGADGRGCQRVAKHLAPCRQPIEMRRSNAPGAAIAGPVPPVLVREEEQDVGRLGCRHVYRGVRGRRAGLNHRHDPPGTASADGLCWRVKQAKGFFAAHV